MPNRPSQARFIDDYLSYLLARASHAVYKEFERTVNAAGFSSLEWRVLATLADTDGMAIGDLAREVLAKHDQTYMPKEVADSLRRSGKWDPRFGPAPDPASWDRMTGSGGG